jgi:hypothetical protein
VSDLLTQRAIAAVLRYNGLLGVFRALYVSAVRSDPGNAKTRADTWGTALDAARAFLSAESVHLATDTAEISGRAVSDVYEQMKVKRPARDNDVLLDHLDATTAIVERVLAAQVERDIATLMTEVSHASLRVELRMQGRESNRAAAVLAAALDEIPVDFRFTDRIGRRYQSNKHVRDQYRLHLLISYGESFVQTASIAGYSLVEIVTSDQSAKANGELLSVHGDGRHPTFYDIQSEVFHPTSQASLRLSGSRN